LSETQRDATLSTKLLQKRRLSESRAGRPDVLLLWESNRPPGDFRTAGSLL